MTVSKMSESLKEATNEIEISQIQLLNWRKISYVMLKRFTLQSNEGTDWIDMTHRSGAAHQRIYISYSTHTGTFP